MRNGVAAGAALALLAPAAWPAACDAPLLAAAIEHAGGRQALSAVRTLHWTGNAKVFQGDKVIEIGVSTTVEPFRAARSVTWLQSEGSSKSRTMIIEGDQGWLERDGQKSAMPDRMLEHERAQYALYGLMLLASLCDPEATVAVDEPHRAVVVSRPPAPPTTLFFDDTGRLVRAHNRVPDPGGAAEIEQDILFEGEIAGGGVHWPRRLSIRQDGKAYFELTFLTFDVER